MTRYRFGDYEFDGETGDLTSPIKTVRLQPQPAKVLLILLEARGKLVSRDALRNELWADATVEFDQGLNFCVRHVRAALDDDANEPRFIETLPRRGYRFLIPVQTVAPAARSSARVIIAGVIVLLVVAVATSIRVLWGPFGQPVRLAILPFAAPDSAVAVAGLNAEFVDQIVSTLTGWDEGNFRILGPASTAALQARGLTLTEIGSSLSVDYTMSGGINGDTSGVFVQMIRVPNGEHVYARRFALDTIGLDMVHDVITTDVAGILTAR
jgi:DNA-binding winged helix-turn-helix (wHTH) protein/TolB-like protein